MKINKKKTKVMLINMSRKHDFPPEVSFADGVILECITEIKLVGVILSNDLKWSKNTTYICKKAMKKMWVLRRLNKFNFELKSLIDVYTKEIRSLLEMAAPVWHSGLTKKQDAQIERVQKTALFLILGKKYTNYVDACSYCGLDSLKKRREKLCLSFAKKYLKKKNFFLQESK